MNMSLKSVIVGVTLAMTSVSAGAEAQIFQIEGNYNLSRAAKFVKQGELTSARKYLRRAVRDSLSDSQMTSALADLCGIDYTLGKLESAEKACDRAVRVDRKNWRAYFNRGYVLQALGKKEAAENNFVRASKLNPGEVRVQEVLAKLNGSGAKRFAENR